jgi:hypothetical protein
MSLTSKISKHKIVWTRSILRGFAILIALTVFQTSAFSSTIDRKVCNNNATYGQWQIGILARYDVVNIVNEFNTDEKRRFIKRLNDLPIATNESSLLELLVEKPTLRISVVSESPQFFWDLSEEKLNLRVSVQLSAGCIWRMGIYDPQTRNTFTRYNNLPILNQPK